MDKAQRVLKNKKGIKILEDLQIAEEDALVAAYRILFGEIRAQALLTTVLIGHIHETIFGELYDWAGRWRTVRISKPGVMWPPPDFLEEAMQEFERNVLAKYPARSLQSDEQFCRAMGHIQGEFLAIHPFREGNARTIKLLTDILATQTRRPILRYDTSPRGRRLYIAAASVALVEKNYEPMMIIVSEGLERAMRFVPIP